MDPLDSFLDEMIKVGWRMPGLSEAIAARKAAKQPEMPPTRRGDRLPEITKRVMAMRREGAPQPAPQPAPSKGPSVFQSLGRAAKTALRYGKRGAEATLSGVAKAIPPTARVAGKAIGAAARTAGRAGRELERISRPRPVWLDYVEKNSALVKKLSVRTKKGAPAPKKRLSAQVPPPPHTPASNAAFWSPDSVMGS